MTKDDRGNLDLTKQIEIKDKETHVLNDVVVNLKNIIDSKEAEMTALVNANDSHRELNGQLRKEIDELKSDNKKLAKQIEDLEIEAKEMLQYP
jgi:chromosome segregation ATPase